MGKEKSENRSVSGLSVGVCKVSMLSGTHAVAESRRVLQVGCTVGQFHAKAMMFRQWTMLHVLVLSPADQADCSSAKAESPGAEVVALCNAWKTSGRTPVNCIGSPLNSSSGPKMDQILLNIFEPMSYHGPELSIKHRRAIRLLKLYLQDGKLHGRLRLANIDDRPVYKAVSYTWGPAMQMVRPRSMEGMGSEEQVPCSGRCIVSTMRSYNVG